MGHKPRPQAKAAYQNLIAEAAATTISAVLQEAAWPSRRTLSSYGATIHIVMHGSSTHYVSFDLGDG